MSSGARPSSQTTATGTRYRVPCFRPNVLACFTLFNFVCVSPKLPWHASSLLSSLSPENPRSRPLLHRCYIPSPTDFVGKVCLPRLTIPVFEIEPGSAHTHTSLPGTRYHTCLHSPLHKTTSQTLLRPSAQARTRSIRFPENRIAQSPAETAQPLARDKEAYVQLRNGIQHCFAPWRKHQHRRYLDPPLRSAGRRLKAIARHHTLDRLTRRTAAYATTPHLFTVDLFATYRTLNLSQCS